MGFGLRRNSARGIVNSKATRGREGFRERMTDACCCISPASCPRRLQARIRFVARLREEAGRVAAM